MPQHASDFKLLAIKPLKNCDRKYSNNLLPDTLYQFYQDYNFSPNEGPISNIRITNTHYNIYNDYVQNGRDLKINVLAIVGKNGSGKSSLVELFYLCAYLVASVNDLLPINERAPSGKRQANDLHRIEETLKAEVYYQAKGKYHCIILDRDYNLNPRSASDSNIRFYDLFGGDRVPLTEFFYTVAVNYSIYGLNESITGTWLGRLFHKNDGYQTPIVLNPFRDQGTINVNGEMLFAQTRLLSNIRFDEHGVNEILPGKGVKEIVFVIDKQKLNRPEGHSNKRIFEELESRTGKQRNEIFDLIYTAMLGEKPDYNSIAQDEWREMSIDYVVTKVIRIAKKYPEYRSFYAESSKEQVPALSEVEPYLDELKKDMTHITLKLRQALNFFRNDPLRLDDDRIRRSISKITMQADLFAERYRKNCAKYPERDPMEFVPLAPFTPKAILEDGEDFYRMSSGEQQFVHSVQSVLYHILNLDSVFKYRGIQQKLTYNTINIIFDEIELYFHPEYQRKFVAEILKRISELNTPNIRFINLLFLTHSPFILSDIPSVNVLHLENGHV
ncbi:ATP-binding cassette domain-containing protein [Pedobacter suwonensis]|uniref:ATP-binding cassette domain-containing protein n=1 Tax=Pedobacter suwonensis TaxID=332999 RepID=UPI0011A36170|nr:ABC transporter ATP-binding protein [Pedobacter suwonensis]